MLLLRNLIVIALSSFFVGCASIEGVQDRYLVCSYAQVWDASLDTLKDRSVTLKDKENGKIETSWLEVPVAGRTYGIFGRELKDAKDRTRVTVTVTRLNDVTKVSFAETRERWKFRGGSRLFGWEPAEPSEEEMAGLMRRLNVKLKERGCSPT
ncbi:MAG: hypothetical protein AB1411_03230 [Nitrospirota bacterium]